MNPLPLYLHAEQPMKVSFEAPALCVKAENRADQLFPLRRIERIQVSGPVDWSTEALLVCADQGICIHFIDTEGHTRGRLIGAGQARQDLAGLIRKLLNRPDWEVRYRQWCWAMGLQSQRYVARRLGFDFSDARELVALPRWCEQRLSCYADARSLGKALQWLQQDLYGRVTQQLQQQGLWAESPHGLQTPIDLAHDLTVILQWVLLLVRNRQLQRHEGGMLTRRCVAGWFASQAGFIDYQIARLINRLELWIMEDN